MIHVFYRALLAVPVIALGLLAGCSSTDAPASPAANFQAHGLVLSLNGADVVTVDSVGNANI